MQPVTVHCRAPEGLDVPGVSVEVFLGPGLPALNIVGLVETAVKESRDRVRAAIQNSGFDMPNRKIVVNLAPANVPKSGSRYDLAIAVGILCASGQIPSQLLAHTEFFGELSLTGHLRGIAGALPMGMGTLKAGRQLIAPKACENELAALHSSDVFVAKHLLAVANFLRGETTLNNASEPPPLPSIQTPDLAEVDGQLSARRALEVCAAGQHHLLMSGPPGTGKSMLAQRLPGLLPQLPTADALTTAAIYSLKGEPNPNWQTRPFRTPHHSATAAALAGGNSTPQPGEISLAHNGVLFLDELPEFKRSVLETLREPLETGTITIARAQQTLTFPARFQLVAAMNPCPCGYAGDSKRECRCTSLTVQRYREKISGPFLDRIDIRIQLQREPFTLQREQQHNETTAEVRCRVEAATTRQLQRSDKPNGLLEPAELKRWCWPDKPGQQLLEQAAERFDLSRRACNRTLRLARTIADLADSKTVQHPHIAEALSLRIPHNHGHDRAAVTM